MEQQHFDDHVANPVLGRISSALFPALADAELAGLARWCIVKQDQDRYLIFTKWLADCIQNEILRRQSGGAIEQEMIQIPCWETHELADCLLGCYSLSRIALTEKQGRLVNEVMLCITIDATLELQRLSAYIHG